MIGQPCTEDRRSSVPTFIAGGRTRVSPQTSTRTMDKLALMSWSSQWGFKQMHHYRRVPEPSAMTHTRRRRERHQHDIACNAG